MKLRLYKTEDGSMHVIVRKTRPYEGPTVAMYNVPADAVPAELTRLVDLVCPVALREPPVMG